MPKVSVIIPCYNQERFIAQSIQSCLDQDLKDIEILVIDDGSTDTSAQVIASIKDKRIQYIHQENTGVGSARNTGIKHAQGDFIQFLDADDFIHPEKLELQSKLLEQNASTTFALCDVSCVNESGEAQGNYSIAQIQSFKNLFHALFMGGFYPPHAPLVRLSEVNEAGGFTTERALSGVADYDLWMRMSAKDGSFIYVDKKLAYYRNTEGSMSKDMHAMERGQEICLSRTIKQFPEESARATLHLRREKEDLKAANRWLVQQLRAATVGDKDPLVNKLLRNKKSPVYVWGAGNKGKEAINFLNSIDIKPRGIIDSNKAREGESIEGLKILHAHRFAQRAQSAKTKPFVVVASMYSEEIKSSLNEIGIPQYGVFN